MKKLLILVLLVNLVYPVSTKLFTYDRAASINHALLKAAFRKKAHECLVTIGIGAGICFCVESVESYKLMKSKKKLLEEQFEPANRLISSTNTAAGNGEQQPFSDLSPLDTTDLKKEISRCKRNMVLYAGLGSLFFAGSGYLIWKNR